MALPPDKGNPGIGAGQDPSIPVPNGTGNPPPPGPPQHLPNVPGSPPVPSAAPSAPSTDPLAALSQTDRNAYDAVFAELQQFGLQSLAPLLLQYAQQGYGQDTISLQLQNTDQWKTRFAGNTIRAQNGFSVLAPADYLAVEQQLIATSRAFGLPPGFADTAAGVAGYIGADISPVEFQDRAQQAWNFTNNADPAAHQALQDYYGVDQAHATAFFLDPQKAQALIDKQAASATMGAAAIRNNVQGLGVGQAEQFYAQGVQPGQAVSGLQHLGAVEPDLLSAASRFQSGYNAQTALQDFVGGNAQALRQRQLLAADESSLFQSSGGVVVGRPAPGSF